MKVRLTLMIAALALTTAGAMAQSSGVPSAAQYQYQIDGLATGARAPSTATDDSVWRIRMLALRREALELRRRDGGTLTPEHHAMLQAKLDRINAEAQQH